MYIYDSKRYIEMGTKYSDIRDYDITEENVYKALFTMHRKLRKHMQLILHIEQIIKSITARDSLCNLPVA